MRSNALRKTYEVDLTAEPGAIQEIDDHDGFDADDCAVYANSNDAPEDRSLFSDESGDSADYITMIEASIRTENEGICAGGPNDGQRMSAKTSRIGIPLIIQNSAGFGVAYYDWRDDLGMWIWDHR